MLTNPQAIIFDMDGVLIDSEKYWENHQPLKNLVTSWSQKDQDNLTGRSLDGIYKILTSKYSVKLSKKQFLNQYNKTAKIIYRQQTQLFQGVVKLLSQLKRSKLPLALASSSPHRWINMVFERFDVKKYFKVIVSSEDIDGIGKPAPDIYLYTAKKLTLKPQHCLVIEDSLNGLKSAQAAGMKSIWFNPELKPIASLVKPDKIFTSHQEISQYLESVLF